MALAAAPLFPTPRFLSSSTFKNCSLKWRWIAVDVYWAAKYEHSLSATSPDLLHVGFLLSHSTPPAPRLSFPSHLSTTLSHFIPWGRVAVEVEWTIEIYYLSSQDNNWDVFGNQHLNVKSPRLLYILEVWVAFDLQSVKTRSSFRRKTVTNNINLLTKFSSHRG